MAAAWRTTVTAKPWLQLGLDGDILTDMGVADLNTSTLFRRLALSDGPAPRGQRTCTRAPPQKAPRQQKQQHHAHAHAHQQQQEHVHLSNMTLDNTRLTRLSLSKYKGDSECYFPLREVLPVVLNHDARYDRVDVEKVYRHWIRRRRQNGHAVELWKDVCVPQAPGH